ncbi:MAG: carboxypeptidase-like regulatory domain-containing protein, partial [Bacteroidales bacterium]|nr:carboxypeptidase-like regulatory domain-containing protein [Bacteroidales bacterium]
MRNFILFCLFVLMCSSVAAQTEHVTGIVSDANGEPLVGATVAISGTAKGTATDANGQFALSVSEGQTLVVKFLGFKDNMVKVGKQTVLLITLEVDETVLEDVVVVGYDTQRKVNLTGSVSSISVKGFTRRPITQLSTALQGMAPGVTVTTEGGSPGDDGGNIQIRGIGSFGGS